MKQQNEYKQQLKYIMVDKQHDQSLDKPLFTSTCCNVISWRHSLMTLWDHPTHVVFELEGPQASIKLKQSVV